MDERVLREKEEEVAELVALEKQTRSLAGTFDDLNTNFVKINQSMSASAAVLDNWREVGKLMALPPDCSDLLQVRTVHSDPEHFA
ncbi:hypothetical protein T484DRAFT_1876440 [Baffinella frigidus]|nr:hypothetical protein T484DRAFT_1876440 [Cryptophyta sp. CCMP2293]